MLFYSHGNHGGLRIMAKDYFSPYGTYVFGCLLPPDELEKRLRNACRSWSFFGAGEFRNFFFWRTAKGIVLIPYRYMQNTLRAWLHLTVEPGRNGRGSRIQVVAAPLNLRWLNWFFCGFLGVLVAAGIYARTWPVLIALIFLPLSRLFLAICRQGAEEELPRILRGFQMLLNQLEK